MRLWRDFSLPVDLPLETQLSEPNQPIEFVYFLNSGLISTDALTEKGESVEVGVIGREGFSGLPALARPATDVALGLDAGSGRRIAHPVLYCAGRVFEGWGVPATGTFVCLSATGADDAVGVVQSDA